MTEQDNHITPDQNTADNNTTEQTTTQLNAPHYITKSTQHNTKNLPLQVLVDETSGKTRLDPTWGVMTADEYRKINGVEAPETSAPAPTDEKLDEVLVGSTWVERDEVGLRDRTWEDMNEEEREYCRKWVKGMLFSREAVQMVGAYMDVKGNNT